MTEPVEPEDEVTESIPRKREDAKPTSEWKEWVNWFLGGF
jgi:hypothetical protein